MKNKFLLIVTGIYALLLSACGLSTVPGSGEITQDTRSVKNYNQLVFSAPGDLTIVQNGREGLSLTADDNLLRYIKADVEEGTLHIYVDPPIVNLNPSQPIRYTLSMDEVTQVRIDSSGMILSDELTAANLDFVLNGSGDILVKEVEAQFFTLDLNGSGEFRSNRLLTDQMALSLDGSGRIAFEEAVTDHAHVDMDGSGLLRGDNLITEDISVQIDGSGGCLLSGEIEQQTIAIHGSGTYDALALQSESAEVKIAGTGDSEVWVEGSLEIRISGSGDVSYRGKPSLTQVVTGSGDISSLSKQ